MRDRAVHGWALAGVFVLALAVRLGATAAFVGLNAPPSASANPDQLDYDAFAWRLAQGEGFTLDDGTPTSRRPPGVSAAIAPVYALFGRSYAAARIWLAVLSAATCVACAGLATAAFGRLTGVLAGVGLALYPGHFYPAMHMLSETPYMLGLALATWATLVSVRQRSLGWATAAGVLWGLTMLVRPQVLLLPVLALPLVLLLRDYRRLVVVQCATCVLVLLPWIVRNAVVMDRVCLTTGFGHVMWGAHNPRTFGDPAWRGRWVPTSDLLREHPFRGGEAALDAHAMQQAKREIAIHWRQMPALTAMKVVRFFEPIHDTPNARAKLAYTVGWGVTALLLLPGVILAWLRDRTATVVLLLPFAATLAMTLLTYGLDRFRDSAAPVFIPFAAVAVAAAMACVRPSRETISPAISRGEREQAPQLTCPS